MIFICGLQWAVCKNETLVGILLMMQGTSVRDGVVGVREIIVYVRGLGCWMIELRVQNVCGFCR